MTTAIICTVLLGLLLFALGLAVSLTRGSTKINYAYPDDPAHILHRLSRAHGNVAESATKPVLGHSTWHLYRRVVER